MKRFGVSACAALALLACVNMAQASQLVVEVTGLRSTEGSVIVEVFGSRAGFPRQPSYTQSVAIQGGMARAEFKDLGPSDYVAIAWHDENGNGKIDRRFGAESFGYSNQPVGTRANWEEARITLGLDVFLLRIDLGGFDD
jgi:uncharacterized protein (DUF2141 family)